MSPARLHHAHLGIGKIREGFFQVLRFRHKIGVENGDELPPRPRQPVGQRSGFKARAVVAANVLDVKTLRRVLRYFPGNNLHGIVSRIIQKLDFQ